MLLLLRYARARDPAERLCFGFGRRFVSIRGVGGGRRALGCKNSGHIYEDNVVAGRSSSS